MAKFKRLKGEMLKVLTFDVERKQTQEDCQMSWPVLVDVLNGRPSSCLLDAIPQSFAALTISTWELAVQRGRNRAMKEEGSWEGSGG